nr:hypothetical protein [Acidobacteriota bacterium]
SATALVALLVACPASFAADGGFSIAVDLLALRPSEPSADYVVVDHDDDANVEGDIRAVDLCSSTTPRVTVGYAWPGGGGVSISWWEFDESETESRRSGGGTLWDLMSPPDLSLLGYEGTARATYSVDSRVIDAVYSHLALVDDSYSAHVLLGVRLLEHDVRTAARYSSDVRSVRVEQGSEADGIGARIGLAGSYRLGPRWSVEGAASYALLRGEVDATYTARSLSAFPRVAIRRERDVTFSTLEGELALRFEIAGGLSARAGVEFARWTDVAEFEQLTDDVQHAGVVSRSADAGWEALVAGAAYRW